MKRIFSLSAFIAILCSVPHASFAGGNDGLFLGGGIFAASNSNCGDCGYAGEYLEIGYDINNIVGIEVKYAFGESTNEYDNANLRITFAGVNIGHDFNLKWFRLYGKVGFANITEDESNYYSSYSTSNIAVGVGTRFMFSGESRGFYAKVEGMGVSFQDDSVGVAFIAGVGYRF